MKSKPPAFLWGVSTSSYQIEGGSQHNGWWAWEAEGHPKISATGRRPRG